MIFKKNGSRAYCKTWFLEHIKRGLKPKEDLCILKIDRVTTIFVGQGTTKSRYLKISKSQYINIKLVFSKTSLSF